MSSTPPTGNPPTAYRGVRALVLGASGFIGRWVSRALSVAEATLFVAVRDRASFAEVARTWAIAGSVVPFDAACEDSIEAAIRESQPDVVFNLVGYGVDRAESDAGLMWAINHDLVGRLCAIVAGQSGSSWTGQRLVHAGSALEYGLLDGIAREDLVGEPHTVYGQSKLAGTRALRAACADTGLRAVTARLFTVYGPGEHPGRLLPTLLRGRREATPVSLSAGGQRRDFAYIEDIAHSLLALGVSSAAPGEWVNLATGRLRTVREFATAAAGVLGVAGDQLRFGDEPIRLDEMKLAGVDVSRLRSLTGGSPSDDVASGVAQALAFERVGQRSWTGPDSHA